MGISVAKLNCMNVALMARSCLDKKKSVGYASRPIGNNDYAFFQCSSEGEVVVVSVKALAAQDELENLRMLDLTRRIRHLIPSVQEEGWLTISRLTEELCDIVEQKIPNIRS